MKNMKELLLSFFAAVSFSSGCIMSADASAVDYNALLLEAVSRGEPDDVNFALERGADPNWLDEKGNTSVSIAAAKGHRQILELLLDNNGQIYVDGMVTYTSCGERRMFLRDRRPLRLAVFYGHVDAVRLLILRGAPLNILFNGLTPLGEASRQGYVDVVRALLENGADPNLRDSMGFTPLHVVICEFNIFRLDKYIEVIRCLLADVRTNPDLPTLPTRTTPATAPLGLLTSESLVVTTMFVSAAVERMSRPFPGYSPVAILEQGIYVPALDRTLPLHLPSSRSIGTGFLPPVAPSTGETPDGDLS